MVCWDNFKSMAVWIFFLFVHTKVKEHFSWKQLIAFILMIIGMLMYLEIKLFVPFCLKTNTKAEIERRLEKKIAKINKEKDLLKQPTTSLSFSNILN